MATTSLDAEHVLAGGNGEVDPAGANADPSRAEDAGPDDGNEEDDGPVAGEDEQDEDDTGAH